MKTYYYLDDARRQVGPHSDTDIQRLISSGAIRPDCMIWTPQYGSEWRRVHDSEFRGHATPPPPPNFETNSGANEKLFVIAVYCLYFAAFFTFSVSAFIGVLVAYFRRNVSSSFGRSHFVFQITTF